MNPTPPPTPPPAYTEEQLRGFREAFAPQAARYRQNQPKYALICLAATLIGVWGYNFSHYGRDLVPWLGFAAMAIGLLFFGHRYIQPLTCPACRWRIRLDEIRSHCPVCGSGSIIKQHWIHGRHCGACGAELRRHKSYAQWRVHACTNCGVYLDQAGLSPNLIG